MPDIISDHDATSSLTHLFANLNSDKNGLTSKAAKLRLTQYGLNTTAHKSRTNILVEYLEKFGNPLVLILIAISGISIFLGETLNASIVIVMIFLGTTLNFIQEHRASRAAEKLAAKLVTKVRVLRDDKETDIPSHDLVPGDVVILNAGDLVPADVRIISAKDLFINEASITGESFPVEKYSENSSNNIIKAGSSVVSGTGEVIVIRTGRYTDLGKIASNIAAQESINDFTKGTSNFSLFMLRVIVIFAIIIFGLHYLLRQGFIESLTFAVAVAVGLTPEFLPMIMTITMSRGAIEMSKKGVIVKRLTSIPTLGSMTILATDKTGTLTEDHVHLVRCVDPDGIDSKKVFSYAYLNSVFQTGLTNPLDLAILEHKGEHPKNYLKVDEVPFDFDRRRLSIIAKNKSSHLLVCKGSPETILSVCSTYQSGVKQLTLTPSKKEKIISLFQSLSADGFRVLGLATKNVKSKNSYTKADETLLNFQGFIAFLDPPKDDALKSIRRLEKLGIEIKIITGDNEIVTDKICHDVGVISLGTLTGPESEKMSDEQLFQATRSHTVFARFSPLEKTRVIKVMRSHGKVVGYLGDGINDAMSLNSADVGISVDNAVDVAKESADFILTHKSLEILAEGVTEGRVTFGNTLKYILMGLSSNFGNMFSVFAAVIFLPFLPMLPLQILLNNFLYDLSQLTIPFDKVEAEFVNTPQRWNVSFIKKFMFFMGPVSSIFDVITFYVLYHLFHTSASLFQTGWFIESLATQVLVIFVIRSRKLAIFKSLPHPLLLVSAISVVTLGWLLPHISLGQVFSFTPLPNPIIISLIIITLAYLATAEIAKLIFYRTLGQNTKS